MQYALINPTDQTIKVVSLTEEQDAPADLHELYALLGCDLVEFATGPLGALLVVDEEGRLKANNSVFVLAGHLLFGRVLIRLSCLSLDEVQRLVAWTSRKSEDFPIPPPIIF